ncbi:threonine-phosphate decarboxylase CobD [Pseudomonas subflava]|uniref:threonine-phosphate decarboxylase CobD n=1 Tax=Pseudomonas subflava TaxID=2952933 RepID=UPI00207AEB39|nr:threonine-phosphate decarboxylase CobD [Pseudomonas subflava]
MLDHGGRLRAAAQRYGIAVADWLDLSTGIAPYGWPLPAIPESVWQRLPEPDDGLEALARDYYGAAALLPVAGSQAAIQALPRLRRPGLRVAVLAPAYAEHAEAWRREGHLVQELGEGALDRSLDRFDVVLVVNPNNPTGRLIERERLLDWHTRLAARGGWLLVDEAFMDCTPEHSLAAYSQRPGLIVLRSFGKFFGLAGIRLGFALAEEGLLEQLAAQLGPWAVSGPARAVAAALLADVEGQQRQRECLRVDGLRLAVLLSEHGLAPAGGTALFQLVGHYQAVGLHGYFARRGILLRLFAEIRCLRFGLPGDEAGWQRLEQALKDMPR